MRMAFKHLVVAALVALTAATPALAREDYCLNADGSVNKTATNGFRQIDASRNAKAMAVINGVWFSSVRNPGTGQVSYLWEVFEGRGANAGLYSYWNTVCTQFGCSRWYQGTGLWAIKGTVRKFSGMLIVSDLNLNHFCKLIGGQLSSNNGVWTTTGGGVLRRVPKVGQLP